MIDIILDETIAAKGAFERERQMQIARRPGGTGAYEQYPRNQHTGKNESQRTDFHAASLA
jgi:hypothetical protein